MERLLIDIDIVEKQVYNVSYSFKKHVKNITIEPLFFIDNITRKLLLCDCDRVLVGKPLQIYSLPTHPPVWHRLKHRCFFVGVNIRYEITKFKLALYATVERKNH